MLMQRRGDGVSLKRAEAAIGRVRQGTDKTAAELAIVRQKEKLATCEARRAALLAGFRWAPRAYESVRAQVAAAAAAASARRLGAGSAGGWPPS